MRAGGPRLRRGPGNLALAGALGVVVWVIYANSLGAALTSDSRHVVLEDPRVRGLTWRHVSLVFTQDYWWPGSVKGLYRPITTLSYLVNYSVLGNADRPLGYHVVNVLLHWTNGILVYLLALRLLGSRWLGFASALLFVAHPIGSEAVTSVVGRADLLATACVLAALLLYVRSTTLSGWRRTVCLGGVALVTSVGLLGKESAVVVLPALVLYDLVHRMSRRAPNATGPASGYDWRGLLAVLLPLVAIWLLRRSVFSSLAAPYVSFLDNPLVRADLWVRGLTAAKVFARYLRLLLWPATLSCDYSYAHIPVVAGPFADWEALAGAAALIGLAGLALAASRRSPGLAFFVLLALAAWLPISNLPVAIGTIMGERLLYLPSIGFAAGLAVGIDAVARRAWPARAGALAGAGIALVVLAFGARTVARNVDWHDSTRLWTAAVGAAPRSFKTHLALAEVLFASGSSEGEGLDRVIAEMERAQAIIDERPLPPRDRASLVLLDLGLYYRLKGDELEDGAEARRWYEKSARALADAAVVDRAGNDESRAKEVARGRRPSDVADVGNYAIYQQLGVTLLRLARNDEAVEAFASMRHLAPNLPASHVNMARAYLAAERTESAAVSLLRAVALAPEDEEWLQLVADVFGGLEGGACAVRREGGRTRLDESCPAVRAHLCEAYTGLVELYRDVKQEPRAEPFGKKAERLGCRPVAPRP